MIRLDKLLTDRGAGPRRAVKRYIKQGRVTVDGAVLRDHGSKIDPTADVRFDGEPVVALPVLVKWHKPVGVLSTTEDPWGRLGLTESIPALFTQGYHPVGRLDADTSGLLLFSRDGGLTHRLLHPKHGVPRTYRAEVVEPPTAALTERLAAGVETAAGTFTAEVKGIEDRVVTLTVTEGKHRMVRRMLNNAGFPVVALHRIDFGAITLGDLAERDWAAVEGEALAWAIGAR